jgi:hypothetical protein
MCVTIPTACIHTQLKRFSEHMHVPHFTLCIINNSLARPDSMPLPL